MPKGYSKYNQSGWKHKKTSINIMSNKKIGRKQKEENPRWMGNEVSYPALHNWVRKHFTKPLLCEECKTNPGKDKRGHNKLQWANKTKKYLRNRKDWICLCVKCHKNRDIKNKTKHKYHGKT